MTKKILQRLPAVLLAVLLLTTTAYGAEAAVTVRCTEEIAAGESFAVGLAYESPGLSLDTASVEVSYDEKVLEFRSCSGGEGFAENGLVRIRLHEEEGADSLVCKIRFRGLTEGESFITVTTSSLKAADGTEVTAQTRSVKVKVTEAMAEPEYDGGEPEPEAGVQDDETTAEPEGNTDAQRETYSLQTFLDGLSAVEFLLYCICMTLILLLLVLLAAKGGKRKGK